MVVYAAIYCPAPAAGAQITILSEPDLATLADKLGHSGAGALATWSKPGKGHIYLTPQADGRLLCHEIKHIIDGHWHDTRHTAAHTELSSQLPYPYLTQ